MFNNFSLNAFHELNRLALLYLSEVTLCAQETSTTYDDGARERFNHQQAETSGRKEVSCSLSRCVVVFIFVSNVQEGIVEI
jgi:hypothetical protein